MLSTFLTDFFSFFSRDLYGSIGNPLRLSRTIVTGKKSDLVSKLLHILSYFIRCSEVHENTELGNVSTALDGVSFEDSSSECERTLSDIISMDRESVLETRMNLLNDFRCSETDKTEGGVFQTIDKNCSIPLTNESQLCESNYHVGQATSLDSHTDMLAMTSGSNDVSALCPNPKKSRSKLSEQLAQHKFKQFASKSTPSISDIQKIFLNEENSLLGKYFNENLTESKTTDDIADGTGQSLPLVDVWSTSTSTSTSVITTSSTFPGDEDPLQESQPSLSTTSSKTSLSTNQSTSNSTATKVTLARSV